MKSAGFGLKVLAGVFAAALTLGFAAPAHAQDRYAAYVMDARTNEVLLEDQANEARYPASLTKMMTLYMLFEALERGDVTMDTRLTASRNASRQPPSRLFLSGKAQREMATRMVVLPHLLLEQHRLAVSLPNNKHDLRPMRILTGEKNLAGRKIGRQATCFRQH